VNFVQSRDVPVDGSCPGGRNSWTMAVMMASVARTNGSHASASVAGTGQPRYANSRCVLYSTGTVRDPPGSAW